MPCASSLVQHVATICVDLCVCAHLCRMTYQLCPPLPMCCWLGCPPVDAECLDSQRVSLGRTTGDVLVATVVPSAFASVDALLGLDRSG